MKRVRKLCAVTVAITLLPWPAFAWNGTGHKTVAVIAFKSMKPATRDRVVDLLLKHKNISGLDSATSEEDKLKVFMSAAIFPDEIRSSTNEDHSLNRPTHHYVNFSIFATPANRLDPRISAPNPHAEDNILKTYTDNANEVTDTAAPEDVRAIALSWMIHQVGDVHQPLHTAARFSTAFPRGDQGGNGVSFPNPRGHGKNLHAYWDDLLDVSPSRPGNPIELADAIRSGLPRTDLAADLASSSRIEGWAQASFELAKSVSYAPLDANTKQFTSVPVGYEDAAMKVMKKNVALAGYRLADQLEEIFGDSSH